MSEVLKEIPDKKERARVKEQIINEYENLHPEQSTGKKLDYSDIISSNVPSKEVIRRKKVPITTKEELKEERRNRLINKILDDPIKDRLQKSPSRQRVLKKKKKKLERKQWQRRQEIHLLGQGLTSEQRKRLLKLARLTPEQREKYEYKNIRDYGRIKIKGKKQERKGGGKVMYGYKKGGQV
jgi:hypothetical protein